MATLRSASCLGQLRLLRILLLLLVICGLLPQARPTQAAAQYFQLTITSPPGQPVVVRIDCRLDADPVKGHSPRFLVQLVSARVNPDGSLIEYPKWITVFTSHDDAPYNQSTHCYDDPTLVNGQVADTSFDMALDRSWFPTEGQYVLGAILVDAETGAWLASMPSKQFSRPPLVNLTTAITSDITSHSSPITVQIGCTVWPDFTNGKGHDPRFRIILASEFYSANGTFSHSKVQEVFRTRLDAPYNQSTHCYDDATLVNGQVADQTLDLTLDGTWFPESGYYSITAYIVDSENYTWYMGVRAPQTFLRKAAATLKVDVSSDTTAAHPLKIVAVCDLAPGPTGRPTHAQLWLRSLALVGEQWVEQKQQQVWSSSGNWRHCYDQLDTPGGDIDFDYALDASWFPINHTQYLIEAWTKQITSGVELARAQTEAAFTRPIDRPAQALIGGPSLEESTWGGTTRGPLAINWSSVPGSQSYDVTLLRPNGTTRSFSNLASTQLVNIAPGGPDGVYRVQVAANGPAGQSLTVEGSTVVDTVSPGLPSGIIVTPTITNRRDGATLSWFAGEDALRYALEVRGSFGTRALNGGATVSGTLVQNLSVLQPTDADGNYDLYVTSIDDAGNVGATSAHATLTFDTQPPLAPSSLNLPAVTDQNSIEASWPAVLDATRYTLVRRAPDGSTATVTTTSSTQATIPLLSEGAYEIRVSAVDAAGNTSLSSRRAITTRDTGPPPAPGLPIAPELTRADTVKVSWDGTPDTERYLLELTRPDGSVVTRTVTTAATSVDDLVLSGGDGIYALRLQAEDNVGNRSSVGAAASIQRDTVPPPTLSAAPQGSSLTANLTATISWPHIADAASVLVRVIGPSGWSQNLHVSAPTQTLTLDLAQGDGAYRVTVAGSDRAGNVAAPSPELTIVRDTTPPAVPAFAPILPDRSSANSIPLHWPAVPDATSYEVWLNGIVLTRTTLPEATITGNDGERLTVSVRALDAAGNIGPATSPVSVLIDHTAPQVDLNLTPATDGSGVILRWASEPSATVRVLRLLADNQEQVIDAPVAPLLLPVAYGESVRGKLIVSDTVGNSTTLPFGPVTPNLLSLSAILQDANGDTLAPGDLLHLTLSISNAGLVEQTGVMVALPVSDGLLLVSAEPQPVGDSLLRWALGALPSGATRSIALTFRVAANATSKDTTLLPQIQSSSMPTQTISVDLPGGDGVVQASSATLDAQLVLRDTSGGGLEIGDSVALSLTLGASSGTLTGLCTDLSLPGWLSLHAISPSPDPQAPAGLLRWQFSQLTTGQQATIVVTGIVTERGAGQSLSVVPQVASDQTTARVLTAQQLGPVRDPEVAVATPSPTAQPQSTSSPTAQPVLPTATRTAGTLPPTPIPPTATPLPSRPTAQPPLAQLRTVYVSLMLNP